jgi:penicillin-binding protein 1B
VARAFGWGRPARWLWHRKGRIAAVAALLGLTGVTALGAWAWSVAAGVDLGSLSEPSLVYGAGRRLGPGTSVTAADLAGTLDRLGYREVEHRPEVPGEIRREPGAWEIHLRARDDSPGRRPAMPIRLRLDGDRVDTMVSLVDGTPVASVDLEPEPLGDLGELASRLRRPVRLAAVPAHVIAAILAAEDRRFFHHAGVDVAAAVRAFWVNLRYGRVVQGGSTVTQQLVKTLGLSVRRSWDAKLGKLALALAFEWRFGKAEILEAYLNTVYMGRDGPVALHGVGAAARSYFGKGVEHLELGEAAVLAGMIRAPNEYSPIRHPERVRGARDGVLQRMRDLGLVDPAAFTRAVAADLPAGPGASRSHLGPYFFDHVHAQVERAQAEAGVRRGGLRVYTSLDSALQRAAETALAQGLERLEARFPHLQRAAGEPRVQGALVALDPLTGDIRALVGGRDYEVSQFNRVTHARRPAGSTFKPFVFLAGLRVGPGGQAPRLTAASLLDNRDVTVEMDGESWRSREVRRFVPRQATPPLALALSLNAATMRAAEIVGFDAVIETARALGVVSPIPRLPTLALGGSEVVPLELAAAYAPLANGGRRVDVGAVHAIGSGAGAIDVPRRAEHGGVIAPEEAFLVTHLLREVVDRGTGSRARALGVDGPAAGKTGSTQRDAWFVGYTPRLVTLVWVGFDGPDELRLAGAWAAVPIWAHFMRAAMAVVPGGDFPVPPAVVFHDVDALTGKLATPFCPFVLNEAFVAGAVPTEVCQEHGPAVSSVAARPSGGAAP